MATVNKSSNGMKNQNDNKPRKLPFFIEFVKFFIAFAAIVASALIALRVVSAQM